MDLPLISCYLFFEAASRLYLLLHLSFEAIHQFLRLD